MDENEPRMTKLQDPVRCRHAPEMSIDQTPAIHRTAYTQRLKVTQLQSTLDLFELWNFDKLRLWKFSIWFFYILYSTLFTLCWNFVLFSISWSLALLWPARSATLEKPLANRWNRQHHQMKFGGRNGKNQFCCSISFVHFSLNLMWTLKLCHGS